VFSHDVTMHDGSTYAVKALLAKAASNVKLNKSDKADTGFMTVSLSLAPAKASGFNLCPSASHACEASCLFTSGLAGVFPRTIQPARIARARMLRMSPQIFHTQLEKELDSHRKRAHKSNRVLAVRLNVLSDVQWEREHPGLFDKFSDVQFYDYTKIYNRMVRYANAELPVNYHLTFSWSGENEEKCVDILRRKANVAVPFHTKKSKPLPAKFLDRPVVNGDQTDLRFLEGNRGIIVGLRAKGKARKDFKSGFIVNV
jgi:hypothetical protein